ncbi:hypothetical protein LSTR_LSTR001681 [Laodelphax striatellus]|uniref:Uncharacterized protein n=1 Tax=Laodelphax striatellus TaxID=195883 RepID=A0A482XCZ9_LAOST|nr:hypothetical protein LSTR_LSTR001681 [Laodelphax striatellus]
MEVDFQKDTFPRGKTWDLGNGESFLFKSANLTALEMLKLFNLHITTLVPKDEPVTVFDLKSTKGLKAIKSKAKKR